MKMKMYAQLRLRTVRMKLIHKVMNSYSSKVSYIDNDSEFPHRRYEKHNVHLGKKRSISTESHFPWKWSQISNNSLTLKLFMTRHQILNYCIIDIMTNKYTYYNIYIKN